MTEKERRDLDFRKCPDEEIDAFEKCPDEEINACFYWECLRDLISFKGLKAVQQQLNHPFIPYEFASVFEEKRFLFESLNLYMPDVPYLRLPEDFRTILQTLQRPLTYEIPATRLNIGDSEILPHTWGLELFLRPATETLTLVIDWRLSNDALKKRFLEILNAERKRKKTSPPAKRTGKGGGLRERLKWLAARRIRKAVGGDMKRAINRCLLYNNESSYTRAADKATDVLDRVCALLR